MGGHPGLCWLSPAPAPGSWGAASQGWHTRWHGFDQSCDGAVWSEYEAFQNDSVVPRAYHVWTVVFAEANQRATERKEGMKEGGKEEGRERGREERRKRGRNEGIYSWGPRGWGQCSLRGAGMTATRRGLQGCTGRPGRGLDALPSCPPLQATGVDVTSER